MELEVRLYADPEGHVWRTQGQRFTGVALQVMKVFVVID